MAWSVVELAHVCDEAEAAGCPALEAVDCVAAPAMTVKLTPSATHVPLRRRPTASSLVVARLRSKVRSDHYRSCLPPGATPRSPPSSVRAGARVVRFYESVGLPSRWLIAPAAASTSW